MPLTNFEILPQRPSLPPLSPPAPTPRASERFDNHLQRARKPDDAAAPEPSRAANSSPGDDAKKTASAPSRDDRAPTARDAAQPPADSDKAEKREEDRGDDQQQGGDARGQAVEQKSEKDHKVKDKAEEKKEKQAGDVLSLGAEAAAGTAADATAKGEDPSSVEKKQDAAGAKLAEAQARQGEAVEKQPTNEKPATEEPANAKKRAEHGSHVQTDAKTKADHEKKSPAVQPAQKGEVQPQPAQAVKPDAPSDVETKKPKADAKSDQTAKQAIGDPTARDAQRQASAAAAGQADEAADQAKPQAAATAVAAQTTMESTPTKRDESSRRRPTPKERGADAPAVATTQQQAAAAQDALAATAVKVESRAVEAKVVEALDSSKSTPDKSEPTPDAGGRPRGAETHDARPQNAERFHLGRLTGRESEATGANQLTHAERARFVQRVSNAFQMAHQRGGEVRLRLAPPELGQMRLHVQVHQGVLTAHLEVETQAARHVLLDNMPQLRDRLGGQDIKLGRFDVDLMDRPQDGMTQQFAGGRDFQQQSQPQPERRAALAARPTAREPVAAPTVARPIQPAVADGLNVVI